MKENASGSQYKFTFRRRLGLDDIADSLTLAICAAEGLHGRSKVRLEGAWRFDRQRRVCTIDASTPVGMDISRLFINFLSQEFGENAFTVRRPNARAAGQESR